MIRHEYSRIAETMYEDRLENGLGVFVFSKPEFRKSYAFFATRYGGMDTRFQLDGQWLDTPMGIAHYLEHKMFDMPGGGNALQTLSATGASPNAFTSTAITGYHFECTEGFWENLRTLLSFVSVPYFTKESVEKEQGIIGQEIRMCDDDPGWRVFFNMLCGLYQKHPVRIDIAGTIESIAEITDDLLYRCYRTFYNLHNMVLAVAGKCTVDEVLEVADRLLKPCEDQKLETVFPEETLDIVREETVESAAVGQPLFNLGIKCQPRQGLDNLRAEMLADITMQTLSGSSSPLYQEMLQSGLVNESFSSEVFNGDGFFTMIFGGESRDPQAVREKVTAAILDAQKNGLDEVMFNESKKSAYGELVRKLGNVSAVTNTLVAAHMAGCGLYDPMQVLSEMTLDDCNRFLREEVDVRRMSLSVITPAE